MKYWLVIIFGDVEPNEPMGPYATEKERNDAALEYREMYGPEDDGIYWLDIDMDGIPLMGSYSGGFFEEANQKYGERETK